jgi:hypothetical protein
LAQVKGILNQVRDFAETQHITKYEHRISARDWNSSAKREVMPAAIKLAVNCILVGSLALTIPGLYWAFVHLAGRKRKKSDSDPGTAGAA